MHVVPLSDSRLIRVVDPEQKKTIEVDLLMSSGEFCGQDLTVTMPTNNAGMRRSSRVPKSPTREV